MQIISGITDFQLNNPSAVAIGKFDGVHLGHRMLIEDIVRYSGAHDGVKSVVFTFNPSPESFFAGQSFPELTTVSEKRHIFERMGVDVLIEFPMNQDTVHTTPEDFISGYLVTKMNAAYIAAGSDISFGDKGLGNADTIREGGTKYGYECNILDKVMYKGEDISSTRIREAVESGNMIPVTAMLGSPYRITGTVSHGRHLGHRLGMPTANLIIPPDKITGPKGVYYSKVYTATGVYASISNVGVKPTITEATTHRLPDGAMKTVDHVSNDAGSSRCDVSHEPSDHEWSLNVCEELLCCESYIYDFDTDIYGDYIEVELLEFVRPEMKFDSIEELKTQMKRDIEAGSKYHQSLS